MDMKFDVSWLKHEQDEAKAKDTFNRLLRSNQLTKEEAEWIRQNAYHTSVSNLASKFLGRMSRRMQSSLGCLIPLILLAALVYFFIVGIKNNRDGERRSEAAQHAADTAQKKQKLDVLIARMREARKIGLTDGRVLNEESANKDHDIQLHMAHAVATARDEQYFGTIQLSRTMFNGKRNAIYYITSKGCDPRKSTSFALASTSGESFLTLTPQGFTSGKGGTITEYYGTWWMYYQTNIGGSFLAKPAAHGLSIQMFSEADGKMIYDGRVLLSKTK